MEGHKPRGRGGEDEVEGEDDEEEDEETGSAGGPLGRRRPVPPGQRAVGEGEQPGPPAGRRGAFRWR